MMQPTGADKLAHFQNRPHDYNGPKGSGKDGGKSDNAEVNGRRRDTQGGSEDKISQGHDFFFFFMFGNYVFRSPTIKII